MQKHLSTSALALLLCSCAGLADLRPTRLTTEPSAQDQAEGRRLLQLAAEAHGLEAWQKYPALELESTDDWSPTFLGRFFTWWSTPSQKLRHTMLSGTFTSKMELLNGPDKGLILGLQGFKSYRIDEKGFHHTNEERTHFYLPALQYFQELPFRILKATHISYAGLSSFGGWKYHRVFVTWGSFAANEEFDQYDIWIDAKTHLIASCRYTVREAFGSATGTIFYEDY